MRRQRRQKLLGDALKGTIRSMDRGGLYATARASGTWRSVAGEQISAHTTGEFLRDGEMVVYVDSPVWATELQAMSAQFLDAMNSELGEELVRSLRFTVSRRAAQTAKERRDEASGAPRYWEDPATPVALTDDERERVKASVSGIEDEALRTVVERATVADLEWKKGAALRDGTSPGERTETGV